VIYFVLGTLFGLFIGNATIRTWVVAKLEAGKAYLEAKYAASKVKKP
jgi:hypothetical protein